MSQQSEFEKAFQKAFGAAGGHGNIFIPPIPNKPWHKRAAEFIGRLFAIALVFIFSIAVLLFFVWACKIALHGIGVI